MSLSQKERLKANPSITVQQIVEALSNYFDAVGHRDIAKILDPLRCVGYGHRVPSQLLVQYCDLAKSMAKVFTTGVIPSKKLALALKYLNAESKPGVGTLKINFTSKQENDFCDYIDDRLKVIVKAFRELAMDPEKLQALYRLISRDDRIAVQSVLDNMVDVPRKDGKASAISADSFDSQEHAMAIVLQLLSNEFVHCCFVFVFVLLLFYSCEPSCDTFVLPNTCL